MTVALKTSRIACGKRVIRSNARDKLVNNSIDITFGNELKAYTISNGPCKQIRTEEAKELIIYCDIDSFLTEKGYFLQCLNSPCLWSKHSDYCEDRDNDL